MTRQTACFVVTVALLVVTAALVIVPPEARPLGRSAAFDIFPRALGDWISSDAVPIDILPVDRGIQEHLLRTFRNGDTTVWTAVGYYPERGRRPAARDLLFPNHGWTDLEERHEEVALDDRRTRTIPVNVLVMRTGGRQLVIVYWYQVGETSIASDHWYRARVFLNRLVNRRADSALVRTTSPVAEGDSVAAVLERQKAFIRALYPELLRRLSG
jgi:EpsI family protein